MPMHPCRVSKIRVLDGRHILPGDPQDVVRGHAVETLGEFVARLVAAELYLGGYQQGDEFSKRLHSVSPDDILRVTGQYMAAIQYAYLGDTTRMHGHW